MRLKLETCIRGPYSCVIFQGLVFRKWVLDTLDKLYCCKFLGINFLNQWLLSIMTHLLELVLIFYNMKYLLMINSVSWLTIFSHHRVYFPFVLGVSLVHMIYLLKVLRIGFSVKSFLTLQLLVTYLARYSVATSVNFSSRIYHILLCFFLNSSS